MSAASSEVLSHATKISSCGVKISDTIDLQFAFQATR
jgi:hypothetical protein